MKRFLMSKPGLALILVFTVGIAFLCQRILSRNTQRRLAELRLAESAAQVTAKGTGEKQAGGKGPNPPQSGQTAIPVPEATPEAGTPGPSKPSAEAQEDLASMDRTKALSKQSRLDKDRQGRGVTRRKTPASITKTTALAGSENGEELTAGGPSEAKGKKAPLRLKGRALPGAQESLQAAAEQTPTPVKEGRVGHLADQANQGLRFCPYGRPIKCELVFTMDSSNTGTPIIALVVEPVYNNGLLVIPAGTELHGTARVDTIRDRICSTSNWVMVLPRDNGKANGRQLSVVGEMLDREEPDANGMTWGLLDGSFGLRGHSIHSMEMEEVKRFVATFMAAGSAALEERETNSNGNSRIASSARNAALEGLSSNLSEIANRISDEIAKNGVFIRVTGGKQFYFYPKQAISPDIAETPVPRITTGIAGSTAMDSSAGEGSSRKRKNPNPPAAKTAFLSPAPETSLLDEP